MKGLGEPAVGRRSFLIAGLLSFAALLHRAGSRSPDTDNLGRWLQRELAATPAVVGLGRRYLQMHPSEASPSWLANRLFGTALDTRSDFAASGPVRVRLRKSRRHDFLTGDLVIFDGWPVARTEARLLALVALLADA